MTGVEPYPDIQNFILKVRNVLEAVVPEPGSER
jgi:hypothetical protein